MTSTASGLRLLGRAAYVLLLVAASAFPGAAQSLADKPCETRGAREVRVVDVQGEPMRVTYTCIGHPPKLHWLAGHMTPVSGEDKLRR